MPVSKKKNLPFLNGGGEMGALMREKDWTLTEMGPVENWPPLLQSSISLILNSSFPMFIFWGDKHTCFYNDAYRPSLGNNGKHPGILGQPGIESWKEIWDIISPLINGVMNGEGPFWFEDSLIPIYRNGHIEDVYWTFSHSPINDNVTGLPQGVLVTCTETTEKVKTLLDLSLSNRRFNSHIMQAPVAMCVLRGKDYVVEVANALVLELWGKTAEEVMNKPVFEGLPEARGQGFEQLLDTVYNTGEKFTAHELPVILPSDGKLETRYITFVYDALRDIDDSISGIFAIASDVTSLVNARKEAEESAKEFRQLAESLPEMVWTTTPEGQMIFASKKWEAFTGLEPSNEKSFELMCHPEDYDRIIELWTNCIQSGTHYKAELRLKSKHGHYEWFYVNGEPIVNASGAIEKWIGTFTNINEQKKAEAELLNAFHKIEESEKRFRNVADNAPVMIWMSDADKCSNFFNKAWLQFTGRTLEEEKDDGRYDNIHPDDLDRYRQRYGNSFDKREEFYIEYRLKRADGMYRWISDNGVPRFTTDGVFEGYIGASMDIHEQVVYHQHIKENEERLNIVIEASELATFEYDINKKQVNYSARFAEIFGDKNKIYNNHNDILKQLHPDDHSNRVNALRQSIDTHSIHYNTRILWDDGSIHHIEVKGKVFTDIENNPAKILGTVRDITDDKSFTEQLQEREQKFRTLADSMPQFVWIGDANGNLNYFNQSVYNYSGLTEKQIEEEGWLQIVHPDEREDNVKQWLYAIETGTDFNFEHRFRRFDGEYRWQLSRAIPQRDHDGNIRMWVGTSTDIQEQKMFSRELEKKVEERTGELLHLNAQLESKNSELEKMNNELQSFAYISSHDLQEPLRKIQTFANRILEKESDALSENGKDYFNRMQSSAKRMQVLIEDLLSYSRTSTLERNFETTDLNEILDEVKNDLRESIVEKHAVIDSEKMCDASIIPFQFRQLMNNLIGNAIKFSKPGEAPHIHISSEKVKGSETNSASLTAGKLYCHIRVADEGIGFDPKYKERIFEVFQRLHGREAYKGTGIGLAIVKKIVENHHGSITATSEPDKGAAFDIYIPAD